MNKSFLFVLFVSYFAYSGLRLDTLTVDNGGKIRKINSDTVNSIYDSAKIVKADSINSIDAIRTNRVYFGISKGDTTYSVTDTSKRIRTDSIKVFGKTNSISSTTGTIQCDGGVSVDSSIWCGKNLRVVDSAHIANAVKTSRLYYGISKGDSSYTYKDTSKIVKTDSINVASQGIFGNKITYDGRFATIGTRDDTNTVTIATGAGYTKITGLDKTNGSNSIIVADTANDQLVFPDTGYYWVSFNISAFPSVANIVWKSAIFVNGVEIDLIHTMNKLANVNDIQAIGGAAGPVYIGTANHVADVRMRHDNGSDQNINITYAAIQAHYIGNKQ
jgi:hypothetical protein